MKFNFLLFFVVLFLFSFASAATTLSTPSVCCEKTLDGAFCLNTQQSQCDNAFNIVPSSCESTSYCKLGTCYNSKDGICMENVPQKVCQANNASWIDKSPNEIPQCSLGCCIISDQAAFVTLARCKSLSTFYGINIDYRSEVTSEAACVELANSQDEGACVFQEGQETTCKFTTRKECGGTNSVLSVNSSLNTGQKRFYKDVLCSAEELGTVCARAKETNCFDGKVYFVDSCGNKENVYSSDADKSWNKGRVATPDEICSKVGESKSCGNCDYLSGGRCSKWEGVLGIGKPAFGDYVCKATSCTDRDGKDRKNGESWCVYDTEVGNGRDPAGSRQYREVCVDGEVRVEACDDFRNQICIHSGIDSTEGEFSVAACRVNRWQDCTSQDTKDKCENTDQRDCMWIQAVEGLNFTKPLGNTNSSFTNPTAGFTNPTAGSSTSAGNFNNGVQALSQVASIGAVISPLTGYVINYNVGAGKGQWEQNSLNNKLRTNRTSNDTGLCVPIVSPGAEFWNSNGNAQSMCALASGSCTANFERTLEKDPLTGEVSNPKYTCVGNCECFGIKEGTKVSKSELKKLSLNADWAVRANAVCSALGDCGADFNINGVFTDDGYEWNYRNDTYYFTQADLGIISSTKLGKGTGEVVLDYTINDKYQLNQDDYVYIKE